MEKYRGIYARYNPGRDRLHTQPLPKLSDITTFRGELLHALDTPEMQKAAVNGLIEEIIVRPTAALEIQCSFQTFFKR